MFDPAYISNLRTELSNNRRRLDELRDPSMRFFAGHNSEPMRDITDELIAQQMATVEMYASILSAVEKESATNI